MTQFYPVNSTSQSVDVFIQDSNSSSGGGLTGLDFDTAGLVAYSRKGATGTSAAITLATQTVGGAWSSGGFVEIDPTNKPGEYRFDIPNSLLDSAGLVTITFRGATNMVDARLRIDCRPVPADVLKWLSTACATPTVAGVPEVDITHVLGTGATGSGTPNVNVVQISGDATAADNLEAACDGTGFNLGGGSVVAASVTGDVGGLATQAKADVNAQVLDVLATDTFTELAAIPAATSSLKDKLTWMFMWFRNKVEQTATTKVLKADNGTTTVATFTESDDGTTYTSGEGV